MACDLSLVKKLLVEKDYVALEKRLSEGRAKELAAVLRGLEPLDKLVAFKLLDAVRAMEVFQALPFDEKYLLFSGFPLQAIAPVLEELPPAPRRAFVQLPREDYDRMFRNLLSESPAPAK